MNGIEKIVNILINRDNITREEALNLIKETQDEIYEAIDFDGYISPDEILEDNLGLEPDYLFDIL